VPLQDVARWPAEIVRTLRHYLAKQPAPIERVEIAIARLTALWVNAHTSKGRRVDTADFLSYRDPWPAPLDAPDQTDGRYSALDLEIMGKLR
jgi:hypothetical protein